MPLRGSPLTCGVVSCHVERPLDDLYCFVQGIGCRPVLAGNIKGLHDPNRNPMTQEGFARKRA